MIARVAKENPAVGKFSLPAGNGCLQRYMNRYTPALPAARTAAVRERSHRLPPFALVTVCSQREVRRMNVLPYRSCALLIAATFLLAGWQRTAAATHAYVANQNDGTVSVIDTQSDEVVRTLDLHAKADGKLQAAIADRAEKTLFVVDATGSKLIVVDLASGEIRTRVAAGQSPEGASISPNGKQIAVCGEDDNLVTMIDVATQKVLRTIATQGKNPEHCEFSDNGRWLLTSNENSNDVDIIDLEAGRSVALVPTSGHPRGIAILPDNRTAYVAQETGSGVDLIDIAQHKVTKSIATGVRPAGAIASHDGKRVFVANGGGGTVSVIDVAAGKVIADVPVGKRAWNMALTADGRKLYVANGRSNSVSVIDTTTLKAVKEIPVGAMPWGVSITSP